MNFCHTAFPMLDDIKNTLWATADKLRANMDAAEYKLVLKHSARDSFFRGKGTSVPC
jgi:type I restriction-modification system DNA methylase subunit